MNTSIIPVFTGHIENQSVQLVNSRELHAFLEVGKDFSNWIKDRINQYGFIENQDYVCVEVLSSPNSASAKSRAQKLIEYHITLDMEKELSMVERNAKGKQARLYFIDCEKQAKSQQPTFQLPQTFAEALRLAAQTQEELDAAKLQVESQAQEIEILEPKAQALGRIKFDNAACYS